LVIEVCRKSDVAPRMWNSSPAPALKPHLVSVSPSMLELNLSASAEVPPKLRN
jgi:hypothetical protein